MRISRILTISAMTFAFALPGCLGGGGGGGGAGLPVANNTLPAEVPDGSTAGIEDYLTPGSGTWRINLDGVVGTKSFGTAALVNALVYDPDLDEWTINVDGANFVLASDPSGFFYLTENCTTRCAAFLPFDDDPLTSQYGTFGYIAYVTSTKFVEYFVHAGLKTAPADMPASGTGVYAGTFLGLVNYTDADFGPSFDYIEGSADVTAAFTAGGGNLTFFSTGTGDPGATYSLTGTATISGNTYQGTVTGWYDDGGSSNSPSLQLNPSGAGSSLAGAFYGPDQVGSGETAGVVYATSAPGDPNPGELVGGFWSGQTQYTP